MILISLRRDRIEDEFRLAAPPFPQLCYRDYPVSEQSSVSFERRPLVEASDTDANEKHRDCFVAFARYSLDSMDVAETRPQEDEQFARRRKWIF